MTKLVHDYFGEERKNYILQERDKYIGIAFIEDDTLKKDSPYVMVEPSSYLEAYMHVLKVLKVRVVFSRQLILL